MFNRRMTGIIYLLGLWLCISLLTWPAYVLCSTVLANAQGEAWQLDAWTRLPSAVVVERFLVDYRQSWIIAVPVGLVAVIDYMLLSRYKTTWLAGGILLPLAGAVCAFVLYQQPMSVLPTLLCTGLLLAVAHKLFDFIAGGSRRGNAR